MHGEGDARGDVPSLHDPRRTVTIELTVREQNIDHRVLSIDAVTHFN